MSARRRNMACKMARRAALAALLGVLLVGCGNDPNAGQGLAMVKTTLKNTFHKRAAPGAPPDPAALAGQVLAAVKGPALLVVVESRNIVAALGRSQINGPYATWMAASGQTLTFRRGVLSASRGLGADLMAARLGNIPALIHARKAGSGTRRLDYLDGAGQTRTLRLDCTIQSAGPQTLILAGKWIATTRMDETCQPATGGAQVHNSYWVGGDGMIWQSRQWLGARAGYLLVQRLRR